MRRRQPVRISSSGGKTLRTGLTTMERDGDAYSPLFILGAVIYWGYGSLNENGWIEHAHDTPVWIKGEWLVGEYRLCRMPLMPNQALPDSATFALRTRRY